MFTSDPSLDPPLCLRCEYDLTDLTSSRCPECGWVIDWRLTRGEETRRAGSPAYRSKPHQFIQAGLRTTALMLFRPIRFARTLRADEPMLPAAFVAVSALVIFWCAAHNQLSLSRQRVAELAAIGTDIACHVVCFAAISIGGGGELGFVRRLQLFLLVSLYASCFIALWPWCFFPPIFGSWSEFATMFPFTPQFFQTLPMRIAHPSSLLGVAIVNWWLIVIFVFAFVRARPRWRAILFLPVPLLAIYLAMVILFWIIPPIIGIH